MMRDESRIVLAPLRRGLANRKRIFVRAQSASYAPVVALRHEEGSILDYVAKEEPTYFEFVRHFLLSGDAQSLPLSHAVTVLFSLRAKGILHFGVNDDSGEKSLPGTEDHASPRTGKNTRRNASAWGSKILKSWRLSLPAMHGALPSAFYATTFLAATATIVACSLFFVGQADSYLKSVESLMLTSPFLLPLILPIAVGCVVLFDVLRILSGFVHGIKAMVIFARLEAMVLPLLTLDDSEALFLRRWPALSFCLSNVATPMLLSATSYLLGTRFAQPWLLCCSFVFLSLTVLQCCPLYDGAAQRLMQCLSVETHLREKIYRYLTGHMFKLGGLFAKKDSSQSSDEWIPIYAGAALLWLYYVTVCMSDVVINSASELFSSIFFGEALVIQIAAGILLVVTACFLFSALVFLVSIPFQNLNTYVAVPLRKARRKLFDYGERGQLNREVVIKFLRDIAVFAHLDDVALRTLAQKMYPMMTLAGKNVINQGDDGHEFFVIADGEADILVKDHLGVVHLVDRLKAGDSFGEIALINDLPRQATIRARKNLKLLVLRRSDFNLLYPLGSSMRHGLTQFINRIRLLGECEAFSHLTTRQARQFVTAAQTVVFHKGEAIIRQGDQPDFVYLIEQGFADVRINQPASKTIALLGRGQVFGMIAVLKSVPRTASVVAVEDLTCLRLTKEEFINICLDNLLVATVLSNLTDTQMNELHAFNKVG